MATRRTRRTIAYALLACLGLAPFLAIVGYGLYLRSPLHHQAMEQRLAQFFGLTTRIGKVITLGNGEFELADVEIFLPNGHDRYDPALRVAYCRKAQWLRSEKTGMFDLILTAGQLDLTPAQWSKGDFNRLADSLRHDYPALNLNRIAVYDGEVRWASGQFAIEIADAEGVIWFDMSGPKPVGVARLSAGRLNGQPARLGVDVKFNAREELAECSSFKLVREFSLSTRPREGDAIRISQLNLGRLLGSPVTSGQFAGTLEYKLLDCGTHQFTIREARLIGVELAEFSPLAGRVNLSVDQLVVQQQGHSPDQVRLTRLEFSGGLANFDMAKLMTLVGLPPCSGVLNLEVQKADIEPGQPIRELSLTGQATGLDFAQLTGLASQRFNGGRLHGKGTLRQLKAAVRDGTLESADIEIVGVAGGRQAVDVKFIESLVPVVASIRKIAGGSLPDSLNYRAMQFQVSSDGNSGVIVQGLGGDNGKSIMTLLVPVPKVLQWAAGENASFDVPPPADPISIAPLLTELVKPIPPITLSQVQQTVDEALRKDDSH